MIFTCLFNTYSTRRYSQVDIISLPRSTGRIVGTSADDDPESSSELVHVTDDIHSWRVSRHSGGGVIQQPDRYMFSGESFDKVPDEQDINPCNYNETI